MEFRLLGPFEARHRGAPVAVGSRRQERRLLAVLLLDAGQIVSLDRIVDLLWDGNPPQSARGVVHTYVGRLRRAIHPYEVRIATRGDGYMVEAGGHAVDAAQFRSLAQRAAGVTRPEDRVRLCAEALALWRGPLLADLADERLRGRLDAGLSDLQLSTVEVRAEARLELGHHDQVVAELTPYAAQHPTRERLVAALMTALYRCRRQADALELYTATEEALGATPSPDLEGLREQILRNDRRLDRLVRPVYEVRVRDQSLPWTVGGHPALEFCNTYAGWGGPRLPGSEWLRSYATLAVWAGYMDLTDDRTVTHLIEQARHSPLEAATVLDEARVLRAHLYAYLMNPDDRRAFQTVARFVEAAARVSVFVRDGDGLGRWSVPRSAGLRLPVHAAAWAAADLLADPRRFTVRACPSKHCGWLFLDESGRRRFCSLSTCGTDLKGTCATNAGGESFLP